jgi:hypothetical protein
VNIFTGTAKWIHACLSLYLKSKTPDCWRQNTHTRGRGQGYSTQRLDLEEVWLLKGCTSAWVLYHLSESIVCQVVTCMYILFLLVCWNSLTGFLLSKLYLGAKPPRKEAHIGSDVTPPQCRRYASFSIYKGPAQRTAPPIKRLSLRPPRFTTSTRRSAARTHLESKIEYGAQIEIAPSCAH